MEVPVGELVDVQDVAAYDEKENVLEYAAAQAPKLSALVAQVDELERMVLGQVNAQ